MTLKTHLINDVDAFGILGTEGFEKILLLVIDGSAYTRATHEYHAAQMRSQGHDFNRILHGHEQRPHFWHAFPAFCGWEQARPQPVASQVCQRVCLLVA